jgi:hypothetical protein
MSMSMVMVRGKLADGKLMVTDGVLTPGCEATQTIDSRLFSHLYGSQLEKTRIFESEIRDVEAPKIRVHGEN